LVDLRPPAVCGNGKVEAGEQCDDGNTVAGDDCSPHCLTESEMVNSKDLNRISGKTQLDPREDTRNRMILDGVTSVRAVVKLCIATTGSVTQAKMVISTGYAAYDQMLLDSIRDWRYQPYAHNGTPKPACSVVNFIYAVK
jgi:TonB family protein